MKNSENTPPQNKIESALNLLEQFASLEPEEIEITPKTMEEASPNLEKFAYGFPEEDKDHS